MLALALAVASAWATSPPEPCGRPDLIGLASTTSVAPDGALALTLTLTDAPVDPLHVLPAVFVDGRQLDGGGPVALACRAERAWRAPAAFAEARHAVHWTLLPWPHVPPALAALTADEALARYAARLPPGLGPWADVELRRPAGALPAPRAATPAVHDDGHLGPRPLDAGLVDDAVEWLVDDGSPARLTRAPVGASVRFRLRFLPGERGAGPVLATCLLDGRQVDAFLGRPVHPSEAVAGRLLELHGALVVPGTGWQRLHCLLLPDDAGERPHTWPRPLLAAYLWGEP